MSLSTHFDPSVLAVYVAKNKERVEDALYELADSLIDELHTDFNAYKAVADGLLRVLKERPGWIARERENLIHRVAGDMRELIGLDRYPVASTADSDALLAEMVRTFPGDKRWVQGVIADERARLGL